jgi:hypothetical protein
MRIAKHDNQNRGNGSGIIDARWLHAPSQHAVETCKADNQMQQTTLYFGLNRPAGAQITSNEWQQFVDQDVTPRFRDGLTVFDARGQWLGNDGKVAREPAKR